MAPLVADTGGVCLGSVAAEFPHGPSSSAAPSAAASAHIPQRSSAAPSAAVSARNSAAHSAAVSAHSSAAHGAAASAFSSAPVPSVAVRPGVGRALGQARHGAKDSTCGHDGVGVGVRGGSVGHGSGNIHNNTQPLYSTVSSSCSSSSSPFSSSSSSSSFHRSPLWGFCFFRYRAYLCTRE